MSEKPIQQYDAAIQKYEAAIPKCCSHRTIQDHERMMFCWGLAVAVERGEPMDCGGCPEKMEGA